MGLEIIGEAARFAADSPHDLSGHSTQDRRQTVDACSLRKSDTSREARVAADEFSCAAESVLLDAPAAVTTPGEVTMPNDTLNATVTISAQPRACGGEGLVTEWSACSC